ncbi:MAG: SDR family NAD(P)-dependent oxidoreductase [Rhodospirillales bacterium]|jgi:acyl transferase domain-containing protein/NAD(P)-dependent dehydrogenase (short-subunit alcohol dehydrogenase family)|nr:SDR family NAD(P)-dependent oxidoreductase [Rhodospirillales bacterium]
MTVTDAGNQNQQPIAIVGVGALFPGGDNAHEFWKTIIDGTDHITEVPPTHWLLSDFHDPDPGAPDKTYGNRGGFLSPVPFDPLEYGIPPNALKNTDTAQLLALIVAKQVLADAVASGSPVSKERISVILGVASATELVMELSGRLHRPVWVKALRESGLPEEEVQSICDRISASFVPWEESSFPGLLGNVVAGRIANRLDLGGTNYVTDAACAGSLSALQAGINELSLGQADMVISGGVDALNNIFMYMCFSKTPALSPTGDCRPFSDAADGTILGEGIGMFALRRLADAERDGNRIYGVIRGIGSSSDGKATSVYAPRPQGQELALRRAYAGAGYGPETVELVEAHGTATKAGDVTEFTALNAVFGEQAEGERQWCALGSIKSQIGHTKSAAGAAGLFKILMGLHHKVLPPTIKVELPSSKLPPMAESPFYINTRARPWISDGCQPRRASVSSFGFGGSNFHMTVEEYSGPGSQPGRLRAMPAELVLLSADDASALAASCREHGESGETLAETARRAQREFSPAATCRLSMVADDAADLKAKLADVAERLKSGDTAGVTQPNGVNLMIGEPAPGKVAFLFPGQGSQYVGMGGDIAMAFDAARAVWDTDAKTSTQDGTPLHRVVFPIPAFSPEETRIQSDRLTEMTNAQPAIALVGASHLALMEAAGVRPDCVAGHSFGEVNALVAAGVIDRDALAGVARARAAFMTEAAQASSGAMLAVRADRDRIGALLDGWGLSVSLANDNSPNQVVLSGTVDEIVEAETKLVDEGIATTRIPVATAFHSPIVAAARDPFHDFLAEQTLREPRIPIYANTTAKPYGKQAGAIRTALADQLVNPVRFRETIEAMYADGVRTFIEVGPGSVLSALTADCLGERDHTVLSLDRKGVNGVVSIWRCLGRLSALGIVIDYAALWTEYPADEMPVATKPAAHAVSIDGANFGKVYPPDGGADDLPPPNPQREAPMQPATPSSATPPPADDLNDFQKTLLETHQSFQTAMTESHRAFLDMAERTLSHMTGDGTAPPLVPRPISEETAVTPTAPPVAEIAPEIAPATPATVDSGALLLDIVAEKTGYPQDMLDMGMELEAGLGIDSIKQVEILSALRERAPHLPEMEPGDLARLKTLGEIVEHLGSVPGEAATPDMAPADTPSVDAGALLLEIIAEKTGYPIDMLDLGMELEAGLGVDSIKQVEILSALRERAPHLPEMEPGELSSLKTLADITARLYQTAPGDAAPAPAPALAPTPTPLPTREALTSLTRRILAIQETAPSKPRADGSPLPGHIAITPDGAGIADALVTAMTERGCNAAIVDEIPNDADAVVYLGGLASRIDPDTTLAVHRDAFLAAQAIGKKEGMFITVQDTGGTFGLRGPVGERAWLAGLPGLVKTVALECPTTTAKAIDIDTHGVDPAVVAQRLVDEIFADGDDLEVGLSADGNRCVPVLETRDVYQGESRFNGSSVTVVSGGARGITAAVVEELARQGGGRFALLGRSALIEEPDVCHGIEDEAGLKRALLDAARHEGATPTPLELSARTDRVMASRAIQLTLAQVEAAGGEARYIAIDVRDAEAVGAALTDIRWDWGPVTGLIHAAGVLADKRIEDKTPEQMEAVFQTKVQGLQALLSATAEDPLRVLCLFSSVAARFGNIGQNDYAMANEVLNKVAQAEACRRGDDTLVKSINWGPWDGGMVSPGLADHFRSNGVPLISVPAGVKFLVRELTDDGGAVEVVVGGAPRSKGTEVGTEHAV